MLALALDAFLLSVDAVELSFFEQYEAKSRHNAALEHAYFNITGLRLYNS